MNKYATYTLSEFGLGLIKEQYTAQGALQMYKFLLDDALLSDKAKKRIIEAGKGFPNSLIPRVRIKDVTTVDEIQETLPRMGEILR